MRSVREDDESYAKYPSLKRWVESWPNDAEFDAEVRMGIER